MKNGVGNSIKGNKGAELSNEELLEKINNDELLRKFYDDYCDFFDSGGYDRIYEYAKFFQITKRMGGRPYPERYDELWNDMEKIVDLYSNLEKVKYIIDCYKDNFDYLIENVKKDIFSCITESRICIIKPGLIDSDLDSIIEHCINYVTLVIEYLLQSSCSDGNSASDYDKDLSPFYFKEMFIEKILSSNSSSGKSLKYYIKCIGHEMSLYIKKADEDGNLPEVLTKHNKDFYLYKNHRQEISVIDVRGLGSLRMSNLKLVEGNTYIDENGFKITLPEVEGEK